VVAQEDPDLAQALGRLDLFGEPHAAVQLEVAKARLSSRLHPAPMKGLGAARSFVRRELARERRSAEAEREQDPRHLRPAAPLRVERGLHRFLHRDQQHREDRRHRLEERQGAAAAERDHRRPADRQNAGAHAESGERAPQQVPQRKREQEGIARGECEVEQVVEALAQRARPKRENHLVPG
jgi:hypothetical protein